MNNTLNLQQLATALASTTGSTPEQCENFIKELIADISNRLTNEGQCIVPHIGTFTADSYAGDIVFTPEDGLAAAVNEPFSFFEPVELAVDEAKLTADENITPAQPIAEEPIPEIETLKVDEKEDDMLPLEEITEPLTESDESEEEEEHIVAEEAEELEEVTEDDEDDTEYLYDDDDVVLETRAWPIVVGVLAGLVTGIIIGLLLYSHIFGDHATDDGAMKTQPTTADTVAVYLIDNPNVKDTLAIDTGKTQAVVRDTVTPHNFLATMARKYYGVMEYWVFIYEENREILPANPNRIKPGTVVVIPDIAKYVNPADKAAAKAEAQRRIARLEPILR